MDYQFKSAEQVKSGLFLTIGTVIFLIAIVLVSGRTSMFSASFDLKARFPQVQGLSEGGVVSLGGINVGNVSKIEYLPTERVVELTLSIEEKFHASFTQGTNAEVKTQGALGDKYVYIEPGPKEAAALAEGSVLNTEHAGDFLDVIGKEGNKISYIFDVLQELKTMLANINANNNSAHLMNKLVSVADKADRFLDTGEKFMTDMRGEDKNDLAQSIKHLNSILAKVDKGEGTLGALINDPNLHEQLTQIVGKSNRNSYLKPLIRATLKTKDEPKN